MNSLDEYWELGFPHVDGWVDTRLLECLHVINQAQSEASITGNVGEIGVYHGKLLIALAYLVGPNELVTAIDVFNDQSKNLDGAGIGSQEHLNNNLKLYGPQNVNYEFIQADSIALTALDKTKIMERRGPFKLFSVDGCHTAEHTFNDLITAQEFLSPGGILILDDFMQPHWPGVTEAVNMFYNRSVPKVKPFFCYCHKLFFVGYGWHEVLLQACLSRFEGRDNARTTAMFGSRVLSLYP